MKRILLSMLLAGCSWTLACSSDSGSNDDGTGSETSVDSASNDSEDKSSEGDKSTDGDKDETEGSDPDPTGDPDPSGGDPTGGDPTGGDPDPFMTCEGDCYGEPPCQPGERDTRVGGIAGNFCSPFCRNNNADCPFPEEGTANPQCIIGSGGAMSTNCALVCDPADENACPGTSTCKQISGQPVGICTYGGDPGMESDTDDSAGDTETETGMGTGDTGTGDTGTGDTGTDTGDESGSESGTDEGTTETTD